jgi:hypothetical protein
MTVSKSRAVGEVARGNHRVAANDECELIAADRHYNALKEDELEARRIARAGLSMFEQQERGEWPR